MITHLYSCRYTSGGFIVNNTYVQGSVLCLSNLVLHWRVQGLADITVDSLAVLDIIKPKPGGDPHNSATIITIDTCLTMKQKHNLMCCQRP